VTRIPRSRAWYLITRILRSWAWQVACPSWDSNGFGIGDADVDVYRKEFEKSAPLGELITLRKQKTDEDLQTLNQELKELEELKNLEGLKKRKL
jgi:hypothetical protein